MGGGREEEKRKKKGERRESERVSGASVEAPYERLEP